MIFRAVSESEVSIYRFFYWTGEFVHSLGKDKEEYVNFKILWIFSMGR
jgi:hypothetical protein